MNRIIVCSLLLASCATGYVASQLIVPPVRAGTNPTRWEYSCFKGYVSGSGPIEPEEVTQKANLLGNQGWEMVVGFAQGSYCFKRPLP